MSLTKQHYSGDTSADPRYAVRFANKDVWDSSTGYNDLKATVTISKSAPLDPGPMPESIEETGAEQTMATPYKILENGVLYIQMPDGRRYSMLGQ